MAKNTKLQNNTEEFIESVVEKILRKQAAQGQTTEEAITATGCWNVEEYTKKLAGAYNDPKIPTSTSFIDNELNLLSEKVSVTNHLLDVLIKKLNSVLPNREASYLTTDNKPRPQLEIPMCDKINSIGDSVDFAIDKLNYLIENVGV